MSSEATQFSGPDDFQPQQAAVPPAAVDSVRNQRRQRRPADSSDSGPENLPSSDSELVDQTRQQIRVLIHEIAQLAASDCSIEKFYEGFLTRTVSALASVGGAIWVRETVDSPLKLHYQINLTETSLASDARAQQRHGRLLQELAAEGQPTLIGPDSGNADAGNPTSNLLIVGPLKIDQQTVGLVEIFQRPGAGPTTQRGYLRFLIQMCDIASDFMRNQRIRSFAAQQSMWQQLEQFIRIAHQSLDPEQTAYSIANEGRRLIGCDRVSVALGTGRGCRVRAVSGLDAIERRADQVKRLSGLAATVIKAGEPLWYTGEDSDLPPQIEKRLHEYVDKSHSKLLAIIPLNEAVETDEADAATERRKRERRRTLGALIVEQMKDSTVSPAMQRRAEAVVSHGQMALTNATDHHGLFLMPVWKALGKVLPDPTTGKAWKAFVVAGLAATIACLCLLPWPFRLGATGNLRPMVQHEIFAQVDGVLEEVMVFGAGQSFVKQGDVLARMSNSDLMLAIQDLVGRIAELREQIVADERLQSRERLEPVESAMLQSRLASAIQTRESLRKELAIKQQDAERLNIRSPADGLVVNWQLRQNLLRRPVLRGQNLMTVVDPQTDWKVELEMPERRMAHLIQADRENDQPLQVTFGLISNPGVEYKGIVTHVDQSLDVHSDNGNTAKIRVAFNNQQISRDLLRTGTRVTARVHCGQRSIGYVMFHELIETVQSSVMFWL